jgi:hypothetical protein
MFDKLKKNTIDEGKIIQKKDQLLATADTTMCHHCVLFYQRHFQDEDSLLYALSWEVKLFRGSLSLGLITTFAR